METQLQNIIDLASRLVINGKATIETALEMAINIDNDRCLKVIEDIQDMRSGYINERNINQKGFEIIKESVYLKLSKS